jgi:hypothetical protein
LGDFFKVLLWAAEEGQAQLQAANIWFFDSFITFRKIYENVNIVDLHTIENIGNLHKSKQKYLQIHYKTPTYVHIYVGRYIKYNFGCVIIVVIWKVDTKTQTVGNTFPTNSCIVFRANSLFLILRRKNLLKKCELQIRRRLVRKLDSFASFCLAYIHMHQLPTHPHLQRASIFAKIRSQSYDPELRRQRCKNLQRHE